MDAPNRHCKYTRISGDSAASGDAYLGIPPGIDSNGIRHRSHTEDSGSDEVGITYEATDSCHSNDEDETKMQKYESGKLTNSDSNALSHGFGKCRFIKKTGHCNVSHSNLHDKRLRFMADIFTTCVDLRWRWNLLLFSAAFVVSWLFFGFVYWVIAFAHGDFVEGAQEVCINNVGPSTSFTSAFLFSLETQTTIGYGYRVVNEVCPDAIITVVVQSVFGCFIDAFMIGLIMAKISRPKKRAETLLFSKNAVISVRDGQLCLMIRVGNLRKSHLVEATIRMQYLHSRRTPEGEFIPLEQIDLKLDLKNDSDRLFLVTPQTISHPIDSDSPLYDMDEKKLASSKFEIIVILEGMVEATGMTTQARASYIPEEIQWGQLFENIVTYSPKNGYHVNFKDFNKTYKAPKYPTLSAAAMANGSNFVKRRSRSDKIIRADSNVSEGRDSGYTLEEEENGNKVADQASICSKDFSSAPPPSTNVELNGRRWPRSNRNSSEDGMRSQRSSGDSVMLSIEDEKSSTKKRRSIEMAAEMTREQNLKNISIITSIPKETIPLNQNGAADKYQYPTPSASPNNQAKPINSAVVGGLTQQSEEKVQLLPVQPNVPKIAVTTSSDNCVQLQDSPV